MVVGSSANSDSFEVSTPSECVIRLSRLFDAPRHVVFEVMTRPEHVREWWGRLGDGYSVPVCEIDLRPGGRWRYVNRHPKGEVAFHGEYRVVDPPHRLVFTEIFEDHPDGASVVDAVLTEENGKTRFTATCTYPSPEVRDMVMRSGMARGAAISYDRLEEVAAALVG